MKQLGNCTKPWGLVTVNTLWYKQAANIQLYTASHLLWKVCSLTTKIK